mmetsp:Transcript_8003/g.23654  ORF Transcript_8003/g.23654 Transcript_8003/m.23654 type:complete len:261 (+) Transcript_8003:566-1348(+)
MKGVECQRQSVCVCVRARVMRVPPPLAAARAAQMPSARPSTAATSPTSAAGRAQTNASGASTGSGANPAANRSAAPPLAPSRREASALFAAPIRRFRSFAASDARFVTYVAARRSASCAACGAFESPTATIASFSATTRATASPTASASAAAVEDEAAKLKVVACSGSSTSARKPSACSAAAPPSKPRILLRSALLSARSTPFDLSAAAFLSKRAAVRRAPRAGSMPSLRSTREASAASSASHMYMLANRGRHTHALSRT